MKYTEIRRKCREVRVGKIAIGGNNPIAIQSMTNTDTLDAMATVAQIRAMEAEGCDIVRVSVPTLAAADTILRYFDLGGYSPSDFDMIVTGDLGIEGGSILCELLAAEGLKIEDRYGDCGIMIYDAKKQDKHSGGSGCGCSAVVLASHLYPKLLSGELGEILIIGTGAMMSPASIQQGQAIPAVAHLIRLSGRRNR